MSTLLSKIGFALLIMETLVGMIANGFIVLISCIGWFRSRKLPPNDLILSCLGLSRIAWETIVVLDGILYFFLLRTIVNDTNQTFSIIWIFTNSTNVWFATWLSVFYLAKIATFSHPVFIQVKQRISGLVPWLILGSVILSAILAITMTSLSNCSFTSNFYVSYPSINDSEIEMTDSCSYFDILANVPDFIPFLIFLTSSILLITSLWKHTRCLRRNGTGTQDLNTQVHLTAIKALASFSVLYLSSYVAIVSQSILLWKKISYRWPFIFLINVIAAYPSGHAIILILINPKLKLAWVRMLHHLKCCWRKA